MKSVVLTDAIQSVFLCVGFLTTPFLLYVKEIEMPARRRHSSLTHTRLRQHSARIMLCPSLIIAILLALFYRAGGWRERRA
jgi:Na+/proline symporter